MKICLVFTPFHRPNSIPFGIAYLKSYLEKNAPEVKVRNFDLNIEFFNRVVTGGLNGLCKHCPVDHLGCTPVDNLTASGQFKKICARLNRVPAAPKDFNSYAHSLSLFEKTYQNIVSCCRPALEYFIQGGVLPEILSRLLQDNLKRILAERPDVIGFSILTEKNLLYALALAKLIKSQTKVTVIFGGAAITSLDAGELLKAFDCIDFIFQGESEIGLEKFVKFSPSRQYDRIPNFAFRKGRRVQVNTREQINDLNTIPFPDFSDFDLENYLGGKKVLPIISSRGCYWRRCAFCSPALLYSNRIRSREIKNVVEELERGVAKFKIRHFLFVDEAIAPHRLAAISAEILSRKLSIYYGAEGIRPEKAFSYKLLKQAHRSGLRWVYIGAESVTQRLLDKMDKGTTVRGIKAIIKNCYRIGICPFISYIIGFPSQTEQELRKECRFLQRHFSYGTAEYGPFTLFKDSLMFRRPGKYHITIRSPKVLVKAKSRVVHSSEWNFQAKKGLPRHVAMKIVNRQLAPKARIAPIDEISEVVLSATKFRIAPVHIDENNFARHLSCAAKAIRANRAALDETDYHFLLGISHKQLNQFRQALREFTLAEQAAGAGKFKARINFLLGKCYEQSGKYRQAIQQYENSLVLFKDNSAIYLNLARSYFYLQEYRQAIEKVKKALTLNHQASYPHFLLGACYHQLGRYTQAVREYKQADCYRSLGRKRLAAQEPGRGMLKVKDVIPASD